MAVRIGFFSLDISNTFNESLYENIYNRAREYNYDLFTIHGGRLNSEDQWEKQRNILYDFIINQPLDGIILSNIFDFLSETEANAFLEKLPNVPVILISKKIKGYNSVSVNNTSGFESMLNEVIRSRKPELIAVISGPDNNSDTIERLSALENVMKLNNLALDDDYIYHGTFSFFDGIDGITHFFDKLSEKPDMIVCFNDNMAIGALKELKRRNIKIPEQIIVTGFDNTLESFFVSPSLTSVSYPLGKLGIEAVDCIHDMLNGAAVEKEIELSTYHILRNSASGSKDIIPGLFSSEEQYPDIFGSEEILLSFFEKMLSQSGLLLVNEKKVWLFDVLKNVVEKIKCSDKNLAEYVRDNIFNDYNNESMYPVIMEVFQRINHFLISDKSGIEYDGVSELLLLSYYYYGSSVVQRNIYSRIVEEELFQLGEDLSTAFNIDKILNILSKKLSFFSIYKCFIVVYSNPEKSRARLIGYIRNGEIKNVNIYDEFCSDSILPECLSSEISSAFMEALHVKNEDIGYLLINNGFSMGITVKSLRHQISGAIKGTFLVETVNQYSINMEEKVRERTVQLEDANIELEAANIELKEEIIKREKLEKNLLKNKNLESLGLLAGGIAHDFNNYLTGILANISIIKRLDFKSSDFADNDFYSCIEDIETVTRNAIDLTQQLLTFSKGGAPIKQSTSIVPIVEEITRFLLRGSSVKPVFNYSDNLMNVNVDQNQISQVLHNIIINAVHAMSGKGQLTISIELKEIDEREESSLNSGKYVVIKIEDTGSGIDEILLERIFDPYFTTKSDGSGLGLATSLTIVRKHGGDITVASVKGQGTAFFIYLPAIEKEAVKYNKVRENVRCDKSFNILILEDDLIISKVLCKILDIMGHRYTATSDGRETIREFKEHYDSSDKFDIVMLDLTIVGGLGGKETIKEIRMIDPDIKAIVSSGYSEQSVLSEYKKYGFDCILHKPYSMKDIENVFQAVVSQV